MHTGTTITTAEQRGEHVVVTLHDSDGHTRTASADTLLAATGRLPVTDVLNLPA